MPGLLLRRLAVACSLPIGSLLVGCEPPPASTPSTSASSPTAPSLPPGFAPPTPPESKTASAESPETDESAARPAGVGVGRKGHDYGFDPITQPAATYWRAKEKIAFEIQIPHALQLFKALSPDGKGPDSHESFLRDIITPNAIELPELPEGMQYRYDPQTETLMVEPKQ